MIKNFVFILGLLISEIIFASGNTGGMDGGGGGTLPSHPASVYEIQDIAQESKEDLLYLLNSYEWREKYDQKKPLYQKLFGDSRKAQEILKDLRLEVRLDKPCYTSQGVEVDGSIYALKPNTICLSAFRISQKLDKAVAKREVLALLMHEVSHFLGATEVEAVEFQEDISWWILNAKPNAELDGEAIRMGLNHFESLLSSGIEFLNKADLLAAEQKLSQALVGLTQFEGLAHSSPYKLFSFQEDQYQDLLRLKIIWATKFLKTLMPGQDQQYDTDEYNKIFNGREYFLAGEEMAWDKNYIYKSEKIQKLHNLIELQQLLNQIATEYDIRSAYTYQVTFGMRWMNLNGHSTVPTVNPWLKYVATYVVESVSCDIPSRSDNEIKFIVENSATGLYFREIFQSAQMSDRIEFGAYNVNAYLNNYGETKDGSVFMTHERGGSWSTRDYADSQVSHIILKKLENNKFELTRTSIYQPKDVTKIETQQTCVFKGTIQ